MAHIEGEIVIQRPVSEVFDFVADERNEPRYNRRMTSVEQLSEGGIGLGTRFRAEVVTGSRRLPMVIEFTAFERPLKLGSRSTMSGMAVAGELTFEVVGEGTRMLWSWDVKPSGVLWLLTPLIVFMGKRQERDIWSSLKRHLEA